MKYISIAGILFALTGSHLGVDWNVWKQFQHAEGKPAFFIEFLEMRNLRYGFSAPKQALPAGMTGMMRIGGEVMLFTRDWSRACILQPLVREEAEAFLTQIFLTHAVRRQMLQLHCATIEDKGRGILFLGPSGIGKTTQAERWAEYRGASIINGDIGFVQYTPEGFLAWGTPWHGSSPYCINTSVPLKALVVLKQAPYNALRELTGFEKVAEVSGSVFYPTWLEDGMELCTATLSRLLTDLPVYRLDNRADQEAVELLARELERL